MVGWWLLSLSFQTSTTHPYFRYSHRIRISWRVRIVSSFRRIPNESESHPTTTKCGWWYVMIDHDWSFSIDGLYMIYWKCGFDLSRVPISIGRFPSKVVRPSRSSREMWFGGDCSGWLTWWNRGAISRGSLQTVMCIYIYIYHHHHHGAVVWVGLVPVYGISTNQINSVFENSVYILLRVYRENEHVKWLNDQKWKRNLGIPILASFPTSTTLFRVFTSVERGLIRFVMGLENPAIVWIVWTILELVVVFHNNQHKMLCHTILVDRI